MSLQYNFNFILVFLLCAVCCSDARRKRGKRGDTGELAELNDEVSLDSSLVTTGLTDQSAVTRRHDRHRKKQRISQLFTPTPATDSDDDDESMADMLGIKPDMFGSNHLSPTERTTLTARASGESKKRQKGSKNQRETHEAACGGIDPCYVDDGDGTSRSRGRTMSGRNQTPRRSASRGRHNMYSQWSGPVGPQGVQGIQGIQGVQGMPGLQGNPGQRGLRGEKGKRGAKGVKGECSVHHLPSPSPVPIPTSVPVLPQQPQQPLVTFSVSMDYDLAVSHEYRIVKHNINFTNSHNVYNRQTGIFTVPIDGIYLIGFSGQSYQGANVLLHLVRNGTRLISAYDNSGCGVRNRSYDSNDADTRHQRSSHLSASSDPQCSGSAFNMAALHFSRGDKIWVELPDGYGLHNEPFHRYTSFFGTLLTTA